MTRDQIVDRAYELLAEAGLSSLSMRRVALDLGVQPGALYYHVANKQELLAVVAARILKGLPGVAKDPREAAGDVSFVQAYRPDLLVPTHALRGLFTGKYDERRAEWAARTVVHYVLGFVAEEQNHAELVRAGIVEEDPAHSGDSDEAFAFGIDAILSGLSG